MENVVLVIHLILAVGIIGLVLIQKSEGGGLGIGGGSGGLGNIATARSTGNILTRLTAIFATAFFITSLTLSIMAGHHKEETISEQLDKPVAVETEDAPEPSVPLSTE